MSQNIMGPYSNDLRSKVVAAYSRGEGSHRELATRFDLNKNTVKDWVQRQKNTGNFDAAPRRGGSPAKIHEQARQFLVALANTDNDLTQKMLCERLKNRYGIEVSQPVMSRTLFSLGWSRKKKRFMPPNKIGRMYNSPGSISSRKPRS
jgi:transposase